MQAALDNVLRRWVVGVVRLYQVVLSPLKRAPTCRYLPTCSQYAIEAIESHGVGKGVLLSAGRVLRCNPLFHAGYHPVPPQGHWRCRLHEGRD